MIKEAFKNLSSHYQRNYFLQGMSAGALVLVLFFVWLTHSVEKKLITYKNNLDSQVLKIDWSGIPQTDMQKLLDQQGVSLAVQKRSIIPEEDYVDLYKNTPYGTIPQIGKDGLTAFKAYQKPFSPPQAVLEFPRVSLIVLDFCMSAKATDLIIDKLPSNVSLILNPYCTDPDKTAFIARKHGHEVWMGLPMETRGYPLDDLGPLALKINDTVDANRTKTMKILAKADGYAGVASYFNPVFIKSQPDFIPIMDLISQSGLGLIETNLEKEPYIESYAVSAKMPLINADVLIDETANEYNIRRRLLELERIAKQKGHALGMIRPYPLSIEITSEWTKKLTNKKLTLTPASALAGY